MNIGRPIAFCRIDTEIADWLYILVVSVSKEYISQSISKIVPGYMSFTCEREHNQLFVKSEH